MIAFRSSATDARPPRSGRGGWIGSGAGTISPVHGRALGSATGRAEGAMTCSSDGVSGDASAFNARRDDQVAERTVDAAVQVDLVRLLQAGPLQQLQVLPEV